MVRTKDIKFWFNNIELIFGPYDCMTSTRESVDRKDKGA